MTDRVIRIRSKWVAVTVGIGLMLAAVPLGLASTPYQEGRAVVLTCERQAMMAYLRDVSGWTAAMGQALDSLQDILDEAAAHSDSGRLLEGGQRGSDTLRRLGALAEKADAAPVPAAMSSLHRQACEALSLEITAAQAVLECVGAPGSETIADAGSQLSDVQRQLEVLGELVQSQRTAISR